MMHEGLQGRPGTTMSSGQRCATEAFSASLFLGKPLGDILAAVI